MKADSVGFTLFDLLGYLLPGSVVLFGASVLEATFLEESALGVWRLSENWLFSMVAAYFLGHIAHSIGRFLKGKLFDSFLSTRPYRSKVLSVPLKKALVKDFPDVDLVGEAARPLDRFMFADLFLQIRGGTQDRHILMALVSFHKASMVAFAFLCVVILSTLFAGGAVFSLAPDTIFQAGWMHTLLMAVLCAGMSLSFLHGFRYFNATKNDHVYAGYLSLRQREQQEASRGE